MLVAMAVGTARYRALKEKIISRLIVGKMDQLTPEQYSWSSSRTIRSDPPTPV